MNTELDLGMAIEQVVVGGGGGRRERSRNLAGITHIDSLEPTAAG